MATTSTAKHHTANKPRHDIRISHIGVPNT